MTTSSTLRAFGDDAPNRVIFIVGPTAIGKTDVSLQLAQWLEIEIVSADSRQVYKYMDIGTAKPSPYELNSVPHHFINVRNPDEDYSAGEFAGEARACIRDIMERGKQPVVVGGSGLYIRALVDGLSAPKIASAEVKAKLKEETRRHGTGRMYDSLRTIDPVTAERLNPTDTQRILRALEVHEITGRPFSKFVDERPKAADFQPFFFEIRLQRDKLYSRIEERVDRMLDAGFLDEMAMLEELGYGPGLNALQSVGYQQAFQFLRKEITFYEMTGLIKQKTRNYAKRQMTWFRKDSRINWLDLERFEGASDLAGYIHQEWSWPTSDVNGTCVNS